MTRAKPSGVPHTCPQIDFIIKQIQRALAKTKYAGGPLDEWQVYDRLNGIYDDLARLEGHLEALRIANDKLRTWGCEMRDSLIDAERVIMELQMQPAQEKPYAPT